MAIHTYQHIDICAGTGMLGSAVKIALGGRIRTVAYVEWEAYAAATLVARMEDKTLDFAPIWDDVHSITGTEFGQYMDRVPRPLLVTAGYPCQPFSVAGKRAGENDPRHLWPRIAAFVERNKPELCFFENVPGHLRLGFDTVCADLERLGYQFAAGLFTAAEVGAAHKRERLFILGHTQSNNEWRNRQSGTDRCEVAVRGSSSNVADTDTSDGIRREHIEEREAEERTAFDGAGDAMAYTEITRPERTVATRDSETERCITERSRIPLFAPAPDHADAWHKILTINTRVKPAVCRDC